MFFINHTEIIEGSAVIIEIEGPLNSETSTGFEEYINRLLENNIIHIILDASRLSFLSSEGIGVILLVQKIISGKNGSMILASLSHETETLFRLLGFLEVFKTCRDRAEALKTLDRQIELKKDKSGSSGSAAATQSYEPEETAKAADISTPARGPERVSPVFIDETPGILGGKKSDPQSFEAFVIKCVNCSSLIRINEKGPHICPECSAEFEVTGPGSAVFS